jgi:two-component system, LytTR family, sensor histidine kinase AlgZ
MHPSKKRRAALGFLLLLFPLTALLLILLAVGGPSTLTWSDRVLFALPLGVIFAVLCRSSVHMCRALPPVRTQTSTLIMAHATAALAASGIWQVVALGLIQLFPPATHAALSARLPLLFGVGLTYYLLSVVLHYLLLTMEQQHAVEQRMVAAQTLAREAELKALRAQLNPHFLFNALNSITALTTTEPTKAREMTITLSEFLRGSLGVGDRRAIPFAKELALARHYLRIELIRFADRMEVSEAIEDDTLDVPVPPLLLQPLVENAVKHGVAGLVSGGWVRLTAQLENDRLRIVVENNFDPEAPRRTGGGHGLSIIEQRLATYYGDDAILRTIIDTAREGAPAYRAEMQLPASHHGPSPSPRSENEQTDDIQDPN